MIILLVLQMRMVTEFTIIDINKYMEQKNEPKDDITFASLNKRDGVDGNA